METVKKGVSYSVVKAGKVENQGGTSDGSKVLLLKSLESYREIVN